MIMVKFFSKKNRFSLTFINLFITILVLSGLLCTNLYGQEVPKFNLRIKLVIKDGDMKNALITITKDGKTYKVIDPKGSNYEVDLPLNAEYKIVCTKMGYITKTLIMDSNIPSGRETEPFARFKAVVELSAQPKDEVVSYTQPVGRIQYIVDKHDFDYDKDYTQTALITEKKVDEPVIPEPKPPTTNPKPEPPKPEPPKPVEPSNPIPIVIEQKQEESFKEKPKLKPVIPPTPEKKLARNITEQIIQEDRKKITIRNVTVNENSYIYKKEEYVWGGLYCYKNGYPITINTFEHETE
jgi:hypothetical protein